MAYTHKELSDRAMRWLHGTMRCHPVFAGLASCAEVPDAIGWTSRYQFRGSIVVECKTSHSDFLADKKKAIQWRHPDPLRGAFCHPGRRIARSMAKREGYIEESVPRMGDFRYFMCTGAPIICRKDIEKHAPDHGLLYWEGRRIRVVVEAPRRQIVDYPAEIRYLRFAIINSKTPHGSEFKSLQQLKEGFGASTGT